MNRRDTLLAILALGTLPRRSFSQPPGKVWRIGVLSFAPGPEPQIHMIDAFREQIRSLGYIEGSNLLIEYRFAAGREERLAEHAAELVRLKVDAIVTRTTPVAAAAKRATSTIPIVMANAADPVGTGLVASLARPGGNVTGVSQNSHEIAGKRLQLLREIVPKATRVAILVWGKSVTTPSFIEQIRAAARQMDITLLVQEVSMPEAYPGAFAAMQRGRAQAVIVQQTSFTNSNRKQIVELAAQYRLPAMFEARESVNEGGLISYGANLPEMSRRAAFYVDRIFKGAKPADLPVEEPTKFEMVINLRTARALGLTIPKEVLQQADEVIQ